MSLTLFPAGSLPQPFICLLHLNGLSEIIQLRIVLILLGGFMDASLSSGRIEFFPYRAPVLNGPTAVARARAIQEAPLGAMDRLALKARAKELLAATDTALIAHFYVDGDIQDLALETGGCVSDSLDMARFGAKSSCSRLMVAGVRFMGETAKILSPEKTVLMPDLRAECSLDLGCSSEDFAAMRAAHPERVPVVYANTSAAVKAQADWMVTSSCALEIVGALAAQGKKILWAPDRHLGAYIQSQTGADMLLWDGACLVHDEFKALELEALRQDMPGAAVLAHPESPAGVVDQADVVGSTSALLRAVTERPEKAFIVATDVGILHRMRALAPEKTFVAAPTGGSGATCKSCAACPWMAMSSLGRLVAALESGAPEIKLDAKVASQARACVDRMLSFTAGAHFQGHAAHLGAA
jgi:quinolinate synthase